METKPNDQANCSTSENRQIGTSEHSGGLTKREFFACQIYCGMSSIPDSSHARRASAHMAVEMADELINALNKKKVNPNDDFTQTF